LAGTPYWSWSVFSAAFNLPLLQGDILSPSYYVSNPEPAWLWTTTLSSGFYTLSQIVAASNHIQVPGTVNMNVWVTYVDPNPPTPDPSSESEPEPDDDCDCCDALQTQIDDLHDEIDAIHDEDHTHTISTHHTHPSGASYGTGGTWSDNTTSGPQ